MILVKGDRIEWSFIPRIPGSARLANCCITGCKYYCTCTVIRSSGPHVCDVYISNPEPGNYKVLAFSSDGYVTQSVAYSRDNHSEYYTSREISAEFARVRFIEHDWWTFIQGS